MKHSLIILLAAMVLGLATACSGGDGAKPASPSSSSSEPVVLTTSTITVGPTTEPSAPSDGTGGTAAVGPSGDSLEYARSLGGISQEGENLFFVVGAEVTSEEEAKRLLEEAIPFFGDMVSYFIVQHSDNFDGMTPGRWVIIEAYDAYPAMENLEFGKRGFPDAHVVEATVLTDDPIPVYEDRLGL